MTNASRAPVDLDALARDLRQDGRGQPRPDAAAKDFGKGDPLAELARIVGQDDPFRALLAARQETREHVSGEQMGRDQGGHGMPAAPEAPPAWDAGRIEPGFAPEAPLRPTPADAFDQYLASVEQDTHAESAHGAGTPVDSDEADAYDQGRALRRARPRRRLASVAAGIGVVAVAIAGALTYKGLRGGGSGGGVPVVQADTAPLKVAPKVADGVEIPDQNRQIYDRKSAAKDGQIRIVDREEQPLDVAEAARAAQGGTASAQGTTPGSGAFEAFGEPRRVRTVAVRPEAPPVPAPTREAPSDAVPSPIPTMVLPTESAPTPKPARTVRTAVATPAAPSMPVQPAPEPVPVQSAPPAASIPVPKPAAVKPAPKATQRVAAVSPETTAATDLGTPAESPAASEGPIGGFAVQLGVRNSAADARAALHELQGKYGQLAGKPELIRQAEVNGKTLYRVRVGPLGKAEAASLCSALQGAGGQCFVAKN